MLKKRLSKMILISTCLNFGVLFSVSAPVTTSVTESINVQLNGDPDVGGMG